MWRSLYEETLTIYKKYDQHTLAINILVKCIASVSINRGLEYATKVNEPAVWGRHAKAQLSAGMNFYSFLYRKYYTLCIIKYQSLVHVRA
jgi:hypothetical protein